MSQEDGDGAGYDILSFDPNGTERLVEVKTTAGHHTTSKWNGSSTGCSATQNWRGRRLTDRRAVVELIGATTTRTGLKVECALDTRTYEKGVKISDAEMKSLDINGNAFHPEWNYTIKPRSPEA